MASLKRAKARGRRSLCSFGNKPTRRPGKLTQLKASGYSRHNATEAPAWNAIDKEVFEWQYVCRTGRPYWWSPESKYYHLNNLQPRLFHSPSHHVWMKGKDINMEPDYEVIRRAVSDGSLSDPGIVEDMAHLIAVQLLGACYTIPLDHSGIPSPTYNAFSNPEFSDLVNPQLISSLRMHTPFRYSPAFGHQPRNSSPVQSWPDAYDLSPSRQHQPQGGMQTSEFGTFQPLSRRRRVHRAFHITEGSMTSYSFDSHQDDNITNRGSSSSLVDSLDDVIPETSAGRGHQPQPPTRSLSYPLEDEHLDTGEVYRSAHRSRHARLYHSLHPVIRSQPHPVYVQPVKRLVVKKLKRFRRRFGGSLHSLLPSDITSTDRGLGSPTSDYVRSETSSHKMNSDGKERRRLARQRGDIHSSSTEGTPYYNSPLSIKTPDTSGIPTPAVKSASLSPTYEASEDLGTVKVAEAIDAFSDHPHSTQTPEYLSLSWLDTQPATSSVPAGDADSMSRVESGVFEPKVAKTTAVTIAPRTQRRSNRKSLLSEVCTPEDFKEPAKSSLSCPGAECDREAVDMCILSDMSSALPSPTVEKPDGLGFYSLTEVVRKDVEQQPRPLTRMNTTGTQLFTLDAEALEVEGLPVGPGKEVWNAPEDEKGKTREKSFL